MALTGSSSATALLAATAPGSSDQLSIERNAHEFDFRLFKGVGDGQSHTVQSALGVATLAGLVGYALPDGSKPFAFATSYPFGNLLHVRTAGATSGATALALSASTTVVANPAGNAPKAGDYVVWVASTVGLSKGMSVGGNNVPYGAQVVFVNPGNGFVYLSKPLTAAMTVGTTLSFSVYGLSGLTVGTTIQAPSALAGRTITGIKGGTVTLSGAAFSVAAGTYVAFWSPWTDAQAAGLQIDGLAVQAAINRANVSLPNYVGGGAVRIKGSLKLSHPLVFPASSAANTSVGMLGEGRAATGITMDRDLGPNVAAICCGDPCASKDNLVGRMAFNYFYGAWRDFTLTGPSLFYGPYGVNPCWMDGFGWGARRKLENVVGQFFYNGIDIRGDHTLFRCCEFTQNFNGALFGDSNPALYADLAFQTCFFDGNYWAGISVSKNAFLCAAFDAGCYIAGQPFDIYGEPGAGDSYGQPYSGGYAPIASDCVLTRQQHEQTGNGVVVDGNNGFGLVRSAKQRGLARVEWINPYFAYNTGGKLVPNYGALPYYLDVATIDARFDLVGSNSFGTQSGMLGAIHVLSVLGSVGQLYFDGDMAAIYAAYKAAGIPFLTDGTVAAWTAAAEDLRFSPHPPATMLSNMQAGSYTLALADGIQTVVEMTAAAAVTLTVPPNAAVPFPVGTVIELLQDGAGQVTVAAGSGVTLRNPSSLTTRAQYSTVSLRQRAVNEWVVSGDLT